MKILVLCYAVLRLCLGDEVIEDYPWNNPFRIIGGKETKTNQYPWMVALSVDYDQFCGASIITRRHALTAAHCSNYASANRVHIAVGAHKLDGRYQAVPLQKFIVHEGYSNDAYFINDVAVAVTIRDIVFSNIARPICLPSKQFNINNKSIKALGWGKTYNGGPPSSNVLKEVDLKVMPIKQCSSYWCCLQNKICTSVSKSSDSCTGDSGGPLVYLSPAPKRYVQVAIVSYGELGTCGGSKPSVNVNVFSHLGWIKRQISAIPGMSLCTI